MSTSAVLNKILIAGAEVARLAKIYGTKPMTNTPLSGPYRAEYGAIHREDVTGFLFTVSPPEFAEDVADALNKAALSTRPAPSGDGLVVALRLCINCLDGLPDPEHVEYAIRRGRQALAAHQPEHPYRQIHADQLKRPGLVPSKPTLAVKESDGE